MKKASKLLLSLMMAFVTVAGTSCKVKDNTIKKEAADGLKGNISILSSSKDAAAIKYAAESFTKLNPNVNIDVKLSDKLKSGESVSDTGELSDIFIVENEYAKHFISSNSGKLMDLSQLVNSAREKYPKWKLANLSSGSSVYGCPWYTLPMALYYRTDIFASEKINPDDIKTWDDFIEAGMKITKDTNKKVLQSINGSPYSLYHMLSLQLNNGFVDKDGKPVFSDAKAASQIKLVKKLQDNKLISEYDSSSSFIKDIGNGNMACFMASADGIEILTKEVPKQKNLWKIMPLPAFEPGGNRAVSLGGAGFFVSSSTKYKELVYAFIKYVSEDINLSSTEIEKNGIFPANDVLYDLKALNVSDPFFNNQYVWQLMSSIERLSPEVYYPDNYDEVNTLIESTVSGIIAKNEDEKPVLQELKKNIGTIIK